MVILLLASCQQSAQQTSCAELKQYAPPGVILATDEAQCAELLNFAGTVEARYGMDFQTWLATVAPQRVAMVTDSVFALTGQTGWTPQSFDRFPSAVPCGTSVQLTDAQWSASPLAQILRTRPAALYVSLAIEIPSSPGDMAAIRVYQDFNCDHSVGVMEVVGEFHTGLPVLGGGWKLVSSVSPPIDQ